MKGTIKIISALLVVLMLALVVTPVVSNVYATEGVITSIDQKTGTDYSDIKGKEKIESTAGRIIKIIRYIAIIVAVVLIAVFGIKFMLGSAEEKAEYKKSFVPLIIGIVVVFASTYIAQLIFSIAS